jgi:hypothetical protein
LFHDFRNSKAASNFNAFAATHRDITSVGEGGQYQHDCGGIVVDDHCRLGAASAGDQLSDAGLATAALTGAQIKFEILGASRLRMRNRRTTEVGVGNHSGRVNDWNQQTLSNVVGYVLG